MSRIKYTLYLISTVVNFFACAEGVSRLITHPVSYNYIERVIIENGLTQAKPKDEIRIFLYGESTMHGHIYHPISTIDKWMKMYFTNLLGEAQAQKIKVVNFGRLGASSAFIADAFIETAVYQPDMAVFYSAHNDFAIAEYRPANLSQKSLMEKISEGSRKLVRNSAFIGMFRRPFIAAKLERSRKKDLKEKEENRGKQSWFYPQRLVQYDPDKDLLVPGSEESKWIERNWKNNIQRIIAHGQKKDIPVIFLSGLAKYKDFPPFESKHNSSLNDNKIEVWKKTFDEAEAYLEQKDYIHALVAYQQSIVIDDGYALTFYKTAQCLEQLGDFVKAKEFYVLSNEKDHFPIRCPLLVNQYYASLNEERLKNVFILNTQKLFEEHSPNGIVDTNLVIDQLHPTNRGQALIALNL